MLFHKKHVIRNLVYLCSLFSLSAYADPNTLLAGGGKGKLPALIVSKDSGQTWVDKSDSIQQKNTNGWVYNVNCTGNHSNDVCIAMGVNSFKIRNQYYPLLATSNNDGDHWNLNLLTNNPGIFYTGSCIKYGSGFHCLAGGNQMIDGSFGPLLAASIDNGNSWSIKEIPGISTDSINILQMSCSGSDATAICAMIVAKPYPAPTDIWASYDAGDTWSNVSPSSQDFLNTISCTGENVDTRCMANGTTLSTTGDLIPVIVVSTDAAKTWKEKTIEGLAKTASLTGSSCTGSGMTAVCAAVGVDSSNLSPVIVVSTDGGEHWSVKHIAGVNHGNLDSVSCSGNSATAVCVASGPGFYHRGNPIVVISSDGGNTWTKASIDGLASLYFNSTSCSQNDNGLTTCIIGGFSVNKRGKHEKPLLLVTNDSGKTWSVSSNKIFEKGYINSVIGKGSM